MKPASASGHAFPLKITIGACEKCRGPDPVGFFYYFFFFSPPLPPPVRPHPTLLPGVPALFFISGKPWTRSKVDVAISKTRGGGE